MASSNRATNFRVLQNNDVLAWWPKLLQGDTNTCSACYAGRQQYLKQFKKNDRV